MFTARRFLFNDDVRGYEVLRSFSTVFPGSGVAGVSGSVEGVFVGVGTGAGVSIPLSGFFVGVGVGHSRRHIGGGNHHAAAAGSRPIRIRHQNIIGTPL